MNKVKLLGRKSSLVTILSLGLMVLGIGCILWAMFSMWSQSGKSAGVLGSRYSSSNPSPGKLNKLTGDSIPLMKDPSISLGTPDKTLYPVYPVQGDNIGSLTIPVLNREIPILQGTGGNELKKGVGHFIQSVLPGENDNCVISGHRDTFFRLIGNLKIGDQLIVETSAGAFTYEIKGTRIVHEDDKTVIVPTKEAVLTLTTCYPFYAIGNAPDRYIISATLITVK